ncbi:hypothetical protein N9T55_00100 [Flavobacteriaceae bacterium]|nr:hypothetical protein [Flavobacteriaceae bacterium]
MKKLFLILLIVPLLSFSQSWEIGTGLIYTTNPQHTTNFPQTTPP